MFNSRWRGGFGVTVLALVCCFILAQAGMAAAMSPIDEKDRVILKNNVHPLALPEFETGRADLTCRWSG
ncbi:MAG TPA: hypothetical protein VLV54_17255 [Thermoanaerobaculia bacterium]|nr:hypothetical protein [Thermoanaerobaculia bacterium]